MLPPDATPDTNAIAYLNDIGFQSFYFLGTVFASVSLCLIAGAKDRKRNAKAFTFDMELIATDKSFAIAATLICIIISLLYAAFW